MIASDLPGPCYLDSSALVKVYLPETDSDRVDQLLTGRDDLLVSDLVVTEIVSAVAIRRREGSLDIGVAQRLRRRILKDVDSGLFLKVETSPKVFREAERLLLSLDCALRAADAIHLALATVADAQSVLTFDQRMIEASILLGLADGEGS